MTFSLLISHTLIEYACVCYRGTGRRNTSFPRWRGISPNHFSRVRNSVAAKFCSFIWNSLGMSTNRKNSSPLYWMDSNLFLAKTRDGVSERVQWEKNFYCQAKRSISGKHMVERENQFLLVAFWPQHMLRDTRASPTHVHAVNVLKVIINFNKTNG